MKCQTHDKHTVMWQDPCVKKRIPDFWGRIDKAAWLIGIKAIDFFPNSRFICIQSSHCESKNYNTLLIYADKLNKFKEN